MTNNSRLEIREKEIEKEIKELDKKVSRFTNVSWFFVILGFIILFIGCGLLAFGQLEGFHELGDFIGGSVGSIWSLAGLFFVYVAFLGQKQSILNQQIEILYNQEELRATRKELAGQKEQMELQNATLKQQQFENTFFQLFKSYNDFINNLEYSGNKGYDIIQKYYYNGFKNIYGGYNSNSDLDNVLNTVKYLKKGSQVHYTLFIDPMINNITQILRFVEQSELSNKDFYTQLIFTTLSIEARLLIAYFSLATEYAFIKDKLSEYNIMKKSFEELLVKKSKDLNLMVEQGLINNNTL